MHWKKLGVSAVAVLTAAAVTTACNANSRAATDTHGRVTALNLGSFGGGTNPQKNFNPYSPNALSFGYTYEPLYLVSQYNCAQTPWLATGYQWSGSKKLTFTIRSGVKWSDGKPFTAADVAFTFDLFKKYPAIDTNGIWRTLSSVTTAGSDKVTFTFKVASTPSFTPIAQTLIVPQHVWSSVGDPTKYTNANPVGTGPYNVKSFNGQQLVLQRNPKYWQASKVKVDQLIFHSAGGGSEVDKLRLARGEYDTNAMFVQDIQKTYVAKDPKHNHYWFPPGGVISLFMNLTEKPFSDVAFRKALTYAIDREQIANKAEFGYVKTASQTGLVLPRQQQWLASGIANDGNIGYNQAKADAMLTAAGYKKDSGGHRLGKNGKPLSMTFKVEAGYLDWIQAAQIIQTDLKALGIKVGLQTIQPDTLDNEKKLGNFDLAFGVHGGTCNMFSNYQQPLASDQTAPIGKPAVSNYVRWKNANTDQLLTELQQATAQKQQQQLVGQLEKTMMNQVPMIPLWYGAVWFEYSTKKAVGWPTAQHPYANPGDNLLIITHLKPSSTS